MSHQPLRPVGIHWILLCVLFSTSCASSKVYQVFEASSENVSTSNGFYVYENDDVQVMYDFWGYGGRVAFRLTNKTDAPLTIDWTKSHLVHDEISYDYWNDTEKTSSFYFSNSSSYGTSNSTLQFNPLDVAVATVTRGSRNSSSQTTTVRSKPKQTTHLPPHSSIELEGLRIMSSMVFDCDYNWATAKKTKNYKRTYTSVDSPLHFRNYLSYSTQDPDAKPQIIDNEFYISSAEFVSEKGYWGPQEKKVNCTVSGLPVVNYQRERMFKKAVSWYLVE
ncbi:MAG: hypothetical protein IPH21_07460 [Flavobacteriales bacterium]|nr:hypothetical protein [Flavobacteriales bacterium]HQX31501.1 hypothetical protein [Flavobacteriales bacterium]HQZ94420.1 hypothetical protein [Flavobacteriales bacterium]